MKQIYGIILCCSLFFYTYATADSLKPTTSIMNNDFELPNFSLLAKQATWFFYGIVTNENGKKKK